MKITKSSKLVLKTFKAHDNEVVDDGASKVYETIMNLSKNKKFRKLTRMPNIGAIREPNFLTFNAKKAFNHLRLVFIKASIFQHFDLEIHICIQTDVSSYIIGKVLGQLNLDSNVAPNNLNSKSDFSQ